MTNLRIVLILTAALMAPALAKKADNPFMGRWDLVVTANDATFPGWMEVVEKDGKLTGRFQPRGGGVRPAADVKIDGPLLTMTMSAASGKRPAVAWEVTVNGNQLTGAEKRGNAVLLHCTGVRAPALKRKAPKAWTNPELLFNGRDLTGWQPKDPSINRWVARDGTLLNEAKGANIMTTRKFDDFKLHVEFNCPEDGNSGVYLRGRYEIQVEYAPPGVEDAYHAMGSIYGYLAPSVELPRRAGQWESFDATLIGRTLTLARNGVTIMDKQEIPGITGQALDSNEGEPGPIYIQGDHTGGMMYRNMTISLPKR